MCFRTIQAGERIQRPRFIFALAIMECVDHDRACLLSALYMFAFLTSKASSHCLDQISRCEKVVQNSKTCTTLRRGAYSRAIKRHRQVVSGEVAQSGNQSISQVAQWKK